MACCDEKGVTSFELLRHRRNGPQAFLYAFDLLELDGADLRREPIEMRKATLASILRKSRPGVRLNEHLEHPEGALSSSTPARWDWRGLSRSGWGRAMGLGARRIGLNSRIRRHRRSGGRPRRMGR